MELAIHAYIVGPAKLTAVLIGNRATVRSKLHNEFEARLKRRLHEEPSRARGRGGMRLCTTGICVLAIGHHASGDGEVVRGSHQCGIVDIGKRCLQRIGSDRSCGMFTADVVDGISCARVRSRGNARIPFRVCAVLQRAHVAR